MSRVRESDWTMEIGCLPGSRKDALETSQQVCVFFSPHSVAQEAHGVGRVGSV